MILLYKPKTFTKSKEYLTTHYYHMYSLIVKILVKNIVRTKKCLGTVYV